MIAESLDLPPKAAKWRQQQQRSCSSDESSEQEVSMSSSSDIVSRTLSIDVRARVAGMLEKEREE
jgi:hypothetical protein